ncbi:MAG: cytochrome b/b6 domain-containing protein [Candidatus Thiodiazotropha sp. 6PLUC2]
MQTNSVTRVLIWSHWLRVSHWLIAFPTLGLLATGFLLNNQLLSSTDLHEIHYILSAILLPGLLIRLFLLFFGKGTEHISDCEPNLHRISQALQVVKFYLTLGKSPLPKWFSHNPLWGPIYLLFFFFLTLSVISGFTLLNELPSILGMSMTDLHQITYQIIAWYSLLHVIAVFTHDLGSSNADISGMINGHRIFEIKEAEKQTAQTIDLDDLMKTLKK